MKKFANTVKYPLATLGALNSIGFAKKILNLRTSVLKFNICE
jgi:hypothetical protein